MGIELKNIQKSYRVNDQRYSVLKGIDLQIPKQKITVILGRSGCGKTTLLRIASGLEQPDDGKMITEQNQKAVVVFQEARLMPWLNVWENVRFALKNQKTNDREIQSIINTVGLQGFEKAYPDELSGGMQQRTAIARALLYGPTFMMMDEPFAALDYFTRNQMQKELLRIQKEKSMSILFVTHSIEEALILGDKIVVIEAGQIKAEFHIEDEERNLLDSKFILLKKKIIEQLDLQS